MSVTHPDVSFAPVRRSLASDHQQLVPFLVAAAIFVVTVGVALAFIGLPS
jgi:hypothetical protein